MRTSNNSDLDEEEDEMEKRAKEFLNNVDKINAKTDQFLNGQQVATPTASNVVSGNGEKKVKKEKPNTELKFEPKKSIYSLEDFEVIAKLGKGAFGSVFLVRFIENPRMWFAMKVLDKTKIASK